MDASIPGLDKALEWLSIPSFLFLPGILIVATVSLWWRLFWKKKDEEFFLKLRDEGFWVIAISLSIVMALLYPGISQLFGLGMRNYLTGLSLADIALVWGVSVLLAVAGCVVFGLAHMLIINLPLWWRSFRERNYPTGEEEPLELLAKLQAQGKQVWLERLKIKQGQQTLLVFLLQPRRGSEYWVADNPLLVKILNGEAPSGDEFRQQISRRAPLSQLAVSLQTGLEQQVLEITQRPAVFRVKKEDVLSVDPGPSSFVDLDLS